MRDMRDRDRRDSVGSGEPVLAPSACPVCRSSEITTTGKAATEASYWRCIACGEVWNVARRKPSRYMPGQYRS